MFFSKQTTVQLSNTTIKASISEILGETNEDEKNEILGETTEELPALAYSAKMIEAILPRLTSKCVEAFQKIDTEHRYKFLVSCTICQNNGTGLHAGSACLWNSSVDSSIVVRFENSELICLVTCFAIEV